MGKYYQDKTVIVTGASSGIGEQLVKILAQKGASIVLCARNEHKMEQIVKSIALPEEKYLILATAHPAKFPSVYPKASLSIPTSTTLEELNGKKSKKYFVDSDPKAIRAFIEEHLD